MYFDLAKAHDHNKNWAMGLFRTLPIFQCTWCPGAPFRYSNDEEGGGGRRHGGSDRSSFLYPKKSQLQNLSTQKIPYVFIIPQKKPTPTANCAYVTIELLMKSAIPQKIPVFFPQPKKFPVSFIEPKKSLLAKISDQKNPLEPPPPPPPPQSVKYVSVTPGT